MMSEYKILRRILQLNEEAVTENSAADGVDDDGNDVSYHYLTVDF